MSTYLINSCQETPKDSRDTFYRYLSQNKKSKSESNCALKNSYIVTNNSKLKRSKTNGISEIDNLKSS